MADYTKIYSGPITALGIAAAGTANGGSFTDIGALDEESAMVVTWEPLLTPLSDGQSHQGKGKGIAVIGLVQTDPAAVPQTSLETYRTAAAKLKITTPNSSEYYFIDNVIVTYKLIRDFKPGGTHKYEVTVSLITEQPDDFIEGPTTAT
jgi:hypothetical protein